VALKPAKPATPQVETTGHVWDGLEELNNPLPKWWLYTWLACIAVGMVQFLLLPSIPGITGYWHGLLGYSSRANVDRDIRALVAQRAATMDKIAALPIGDVVRDQGLLQAANTSGRITFANNCQPCHGAGGAGLPGYPALAVGAWIWGGKLAEIEKTLIHGIRSGDPDARVSAMPRFGADGLLTAAEIEAVADYVMTFYGTPTKAADTAKGGELYAANCAACHGEAGQGNRTLGAPALKSRVHLYGSTREEVVAQITNPRQGVMPAWSTRLDAATLKSVAIYVHGLGGGE
jgi:cytochrome c oxidase cbb3-type subunit 3